RYWKKMEELYLAVVGVKDTKKYFDRTEYMMDCIRFNRSYISRKTKKILVTANMSAGKSTLLNSLIGKKVNKTQNDTCTAKTHLLYNKAFEDSLSYEYDYDLELNASLEVLMEDNTNNVSKEIYVGTRFRTIEDIDIPICFIDTPGVNSSQDEEHKKISEEMIINEEYDLLLYVLNGENIGTDDDKKHLRFVANNYKGRIVFVINKLDRFRAKDDSVKRTLENVKKDLIELGYNNPIVCPTSAYAAYLAKMKIFGEELNEDELDEYEGFCRKLKKDQFRFEQYYSEELTTEKNDNKEELLLLHSGILSLERILYKER
nr:dynamin family protein [Lachnospiraceae bacterium]